MKWCCRYILLLYLFQNLSLKRQSYTIKQRWGNWGLTLREDIKCTKTHLFPITIGDNGRHQLRDTEAHYCTLTVNNYNNTYHRTDTFSFLFYIVQGCLSINSGYCIYFPFSGYKDAAALHWQMCKTQINTTMSINTSYMKYTSSQNSPVILWYTE